MRTASDAWVGRVAATGGHLVSMRAKEPQRVKTNPRWYRQATKEEDATLYNNQSVRAAAQDACCKMMCHWPCSGHARALTRALSASMYTMTHFKALRSAGGSTALDMQLGTQLITDPIQMLPVSHVSCDWWVGRYTEMKSVEPQDSPGAPEQGIPQSDGSTSPAVGADPPGQGKKGVAAAWHCQVRAMRLGLCGVCMHAR